MRDARRYQALSRHTNPGARADMLGGLPHSVEGICAIAAKQTVHHNLRAALSAPVEPGVRVRPPALENVLAALAALEPHTLSLERRLNRRVVGACVLESHFLAGLLRYRGYAVRIRAGYFSGIRADPDHVVAFWNAVARWKGQEPDDDYVRQQNAVDHHIEHWLCELWEGGAWTLVDANTDFHRLHSRLDVDIRLPRALFQYAFQAWRALRDDHTVPEERYIEEPHTGRAHVRRQLLQDFFSLLNHDLAPVDELSVADSTYEELAELVARDPDVSELVAFYRARPDLRLSSAEADGYSFVSREHVPSESPSGDWPWRSRTS